MVLTVCFSRIFGGSQRGSAAVCDPNLRVHLLGKDRVHAKGVVLCERTCFCLLSAFYETLRSKNPSKNPSKNLVFTQNLYRAPSKNPSKKHLLLENLLRTLLRSVRLHDPLGVRPKREKVQASSGAERLLEAFIRCLHRDISRGHQC